MAAVRTLKNKAYHKRFQTKWRRRREGKTDYHRRNRLIVQDKRKYNSPKYRLVVRLTNKDIICQVVAAKIIGDEVLTAAYAHELPKYGVKLGLTNFAAAYCVGLLCARRHLEKIGLSEIYKGVEEVDGEMFEIEENDDKRPFRAVLDVGLARCTTGNRIFAVMKGAVDGGINVPHNEKRFPAYSKEEGFDPEQLKLRILGNHVSEYMNYLREEDEDRYNKQFSAYVREGIDPDDIEDMYVKAHEKIREDPSPVKKERTVVPHNDTWRQKKITLAQRQENVRKKIAAAVQGDE